ncbi:LytR/AlgR family response regulator transcription factor [Sharpea azabuensis]|uniref:LytR/AlgR family response regulator transcription factor n=1 Tax=Sharpea azabuensis TaxID=322505 RepID=UPI00240A6DA1|nr:LytTR family DNA-binding domain-containing protein [Sharpea azabuensis]MDD6513800.1 LytTR family DNA-binding domain-containing protein [Sharpea azabuensis]
MLRMAICDDSPSDLNRINDMLMHFLESHNIEHEVELFPNGHALLESPISYDLILLDIEMEGKNGIEIAQELRTFNTDSKIVFITNSTSIDHLQQGYKVKADRYLVKPINQQEFNFEINSVIKDQLVDNKFILDKRISPYKLYLKDIIYIEFYNRKTIIHMNDQKISTYIALKEWISLLEDYHFSQCHKGYIVNLSFIQHMNTEKLTLLNNEHLPLGRKYKDKLKLDYYTFIGEKV